MEFPEYKSLLLTSQDINLESNCHWSLSFTCTLDVDLDIRFICCKRETSNTHFSNFAVPSPKSLISKSLRLIDRWYFFQQNFQFIQDSNQILHRVGNVNFWISSLFSLDHDGDSIYEANYIIKCFGALPLNHITRNLYFLLR